MANICVTDLKIFGPKEELDIIEDLFIKLYGEHCDSNDTWVGRIVEDGLKMSADYMCTRGSVVYFDRISDTEFDVSQDDKWNPQLDAYRILIDEKHLNNTYITYVAVEPGCVIYLSNNDDYVGKYLVDIYEPNEVPVPFQRYDYDFVEPRDLYQSLLECTDMDEPFSPENFAALMKRFHDEYGDYCSIHEIEYCDVDEL